MAQTKNEILNQLKESARRMREVREAAESIRLTRLGAEPDPVPLNVNLTQPPPRFVGQPEGPNLPAV